MINESPNIPKKIQPEERFTLLLKEELKRHAQAINKLYGGIKENEQSIINIDLSDYYTKQQVDNALNTFDQRISSINAVTPSDVSQAIEQALSNLDIDVDVELPLWLQRFEIQNGKLCQKVSG